MKKDNSDTYTRRVIRGLFLLCLWVLWLLLPVSVCRAEGKVVRVGSFEDTFNFIDQNGVRHGEIDIMGDISYTDERAEKMLYSDMPMGEEKYIWTACRCASGIEN